MMPQRSIQSKVAWTMELNARTNWHPCLKINAPRDCRMAITTIMMIINCVLQAQNSIKFTLQAQNSTKFDIFEPEIELIIHFANSWRRNVFPRSA